MTKTFNISPHLLNLEKIVHCIMSYLEFYLRHKISFSVKKTAMTPQILPFLYADCINFSIKQTRDYLIVSNMYYFKAYKTLKKGCFKYTKLQNEYVVLHVSLIVLDHFPLGKLRILKHNFVSKISSKYNHGVNR